MNLQFTTDYNPKGRPKEINFIFGFQPPQDYKLPVPLTHIKHIGDDGDLVSWELSHPPDMAYRLTSFAVNVIGEQFTTSVNSDIR
jgi:hypothetical protein